MRVETEIAAPVTAARPLCRVARELNIPVRLLRAHFPEQCLTLAARHRLRRCQEIRERDRQLQVQIREAIAALGQRAAVLSMNRIECELKRPGLFNRHYARRIYRQTLQTHNARATTVH